ncbi:MAG: glycosyltransferase [Gammaproteobacteria bacterium]|nr:glycosyltransferase [Gammaproteobacteria bacterium]
MLDKKEKIAHYDRLARSRGYWREKNAYYYDWLDRFIATLVPPGGNVIELGCGTGDLLASLRPARGLGIDFSPEMVAVASENHGRNENLEFRADDIESLDVDETFDFVVMSDTIGELTDTWQAIRNLHAVTNADSRVVITYFNPLWEPVLRLGEAMEWKMPQDYQNWLNLGDIRNLLALNGFEPIRYGYQLLLPKRVPVVSDLVNRYLARLPLIERLSLVTYVVARPAEAPARPAHEPSVSVVIPCRNEKGNIRDAVERVPAMGSHTEIVFVDGNSNDGTVEEIEKTIEAFRGEKDLKLIHQVPEGSEDGAGHGKMLQLGKGDAVRKGFAAAEGEILMILDADLTVPPEDLPKFYLALVEGRGEFINGTRLVYPMEKDAMRFLNKIANKLFGILFSWLLEQPVKDTLCGTKVLTRDDYRRISEGRSYFGDFDPFGDFDLLFGAARLNLKIVEVPIRYRERVYGDIKIERFRHGLLLLRMCWIAMKKLKFR